MPKFPVKCLAADGTYTQPGSPQKFVWKGTLKANKVTGNYIDPLGGTGELLHGQGRHLTPATKSFTGTLSFHRPAARHRHRQGQEGLAIDRRVRGGNAPHPSSARERVDR